jgi:hypothetical protein
MTRTCLTTTPVFVSHTVDIPTCCPVSGNPRPGSTIRVSYLAYGVVMPVEDLVDMMAEYVGGRGTIRGMEEMIQEIAQRCAKETGVKVHARADLILTPPYGGADQRMRVTARAG